MSSLIRITRQVRFSNLSPSRKSKSFVIQLRRSLILRLQCSLQTSPTNNSTTITAPSLELHRLPSDQTSDRAPLPRRKQPPSRVILVEGTFTSATVLLCALTPVYPSA